MRPSLWNYLINFIYSSLFFFLCCSSAHTSQGLRNLAEANQQQYRDLKALGTKPSIGAAEGLRQKNFNVPERSAAEERGRALGDWKKKIKNEEPVDPTRKLAGQSPTTPEDGSSKDQKTTTPISSSSGRTSGNRRVGFTTTGDVEGEAGASPVYFGVEKEKAPAETPFWGE